MAVHDLLVASLACLPAPQLPSAATLETLLRPPQLVVQRNFLSPALVSALAADVASLRRRGVTGTAATASHGSVAWMPLLPTPPDSDASDDEVGLRGRALLLQVIRDLQALLDERTGVALDLSPELKYAFYPCGGRYQRHVDGMNVGSVAREYSILLYLNDGWTPADGGHLRCFDADGGYMDVAPEAGTLVLFKSDVVPHEVRPTTAKRLAVVGWLHRRQEVPVVDEAALSPLARAIREHYAAQGKVVKLSS